MRNLKWHWIALLYLCVSVSLHAGTLTVTTNSDEENCRSEGGCATLPNSGGTHYPNSTGCSLREALDDILDVGNNVTQRFPECGTADKGPPSIIPLTYTNTIVLAAHSINVNSAVPDPTIDPNPPGGPVPACASASPVKCPFQYGELSHIGNATTFGNLQITGGTLTCTDSNMVHVNPAGDLTMAGSSFQNCTTDGVGVAIYDQNDANLTLFGVTFTNIHGTLDSIGGCIQHGSGNLLITGGSFTACVEDDGSGSGIYPVGGGTGGLGGAISIGSVGSAQRVAISGVTFQANVASQKGGAIYMSGTDAVTIDTSTFQANLSFGDASANSQNGGGAIYAQNTATGPIPSPPPMGVNASDFLLFQDNFLANLAVNGNGGAILLYNGKLTYGNGSLSLGPAGASIAGQIPGGIIASNFSANQAQGVANADSRSGSGGAIYAESAQLAILDSSFVGGNASSSASGGAIGYMDASNSNPPVSISNTTFNGNSAAVNGGAIANLRYTNTNQGGKVTLINDTLSGNTTTSAGGGGNFYNGNNNSAADVNVSNTIFVDGGPSGNCAGTAFTNLTSNLQFNPIADCGTATPKDPMLKPASIFSGPNILVFTMDLNSGSAASGTGDPATCLASPIDNLDGAVNGRPSGAPNCDIGAFESGNAPVYASTPAPGSTINISALTTMPMTATVDISNTGSDNLIISNFSTTGGPQISVSGAATPFTIPVGNSTQTLTLTCTDAAASNTSGTLTVTHNAAGSPATYPVNCDVTMPATPLSITTTSPLPQGTVGSAYSQTFAATGGMPPYSNWQITAGTPPAWATLDPTTGMLTGTPPGTIGSPYTFTVQVTDSAMATATKQFMLTVVAPPLSITTASPLPQALVGNAYSQTFAAMGGVPPYANWIVTAGTAPAWATLNPATGALTGTPPNTAGSPFTFTVQVTDSEAVTTTKQFMLTVAPPPLAITTASPLPNAMVAVAYNQMFAASGGTPPYTNWAITGGTAPGWATLVAATGAFAGTPPNTAGSPFTFTLTVTDSAMATANKQFMLQVLPPALVITTASPLPNATVGSAYSQTFAAAGGIPPYVSWAVVGGALPAWATLNAATGALTGTPPDTTGSPFSFTIQVTDTAAATTSKLFTLTVAPITPVRLQSFSVD